MTAQKKGWFKIPGIQDGDRTIEQQMKGLDRLCAEAPGKTVLDLGCAEGLVGMRLLTQHEAAAVTGLSLVKSEIKVGQRLAADQGLAMQLYCVNLNEVEAWHAENAGNLGAQFDVLLMMAILHKLKEPLQFLTFVVNTFSPAMLVIRTAEATPGYVQDARSGDRRFDIIAHLEQLGFKLDSVATGSFKEWTGYFVRA